MNESNEDMCERAHRFMEWLMRRPEQHIAVVTHSAFMAGPYELSNRIQLDPELESAWF
jgi:broad specificity phosphatase PhoE